MTRSGAAMIISFIIVIVGLVAIFLDIQGQGFLDIKSAFVSGQIKTGHIGVILLFMGIFLACYAISIPGAAKHKIEIFGRKKKIVYTGRLSFEAYQTLFELVRDLEGVDISVDSKSDLSKNDGLADRDRDAHR